MASIKRSPPESVGMCGERLSAIDDLMHRQIEQGTFAGISTLIARRGKVVHFKQFGCRDREADLPMQADTLFRIYSMTKPIVCTAFMRLYEQGKVDLTQPVADFIPAFAKLKVLQRQTDGSDKLMALERPVTVRHLLTHTSGLAYEFEEHPVSALYRANRLSAGARDMSLAAFIDKLCQMPLAFQPGEHWFYGVNIDVIGHLIEIIADKPLHEFLHDTIFAPLGMTETAYHVPETRRHRLAAMYGAMDLFDPGVTQKTMIDAWQRGVNKRLDVSATDPIDKPDFCLGGTGLKSTAQDYLRFAQMLLNKGKLDGVRLLAPKTIALMHMNHLPAKLLPFAVGSIVFDGYGFGLGSRVLLNVAEAQTLGSRDSYGWGGAAKTYYWVDPQEELLGIFLAQWLGNFSMIERAFQTLAYQSVVKPCAPSSRRDRDNAPHSLDRRKPVAVGRVPTKHKAHRQRPAPLI